MKMKGLYKKRGCGVNSNKTKVTLVKRQIEKKSWFHLYHMSTIV